MRRESQDHGQDLQVGAPMATVRALVSLSVALHGAIRHAASTGVEAGWHGLTSHEQCVCGCLTVLTTHT